MHSSSHSMPAQACYYARPGDLLLFRWLPDARMMPHLGGALDSFAPVPGFAAGVRSAPGDTRALILVWCPRHVAQAAKAAIDGAIGPGELTPWAGHLHLEGGLDAPRRPAAYHAGRACQSGAAGLAARPARADAAGGRS